MIKKWLENFNMVGAIECTSLITRITVRLDALSCASISYISSPRLMVDENYLVYGHTLLQNQSLQTPQHRRFKLNRW
jgi:hypothetical protein